MITIFDIITSNHIADIIITCKYFRFNTSLVNLESSNKNKTRFDISKKFVRGSKKT